MDLYQLPVKTKLGECEYHLHTDYRDILEIFSYLDDPEGLLLAGKLSFPEITGLCPVRRQTGAGRQTPDI